MERKAKADLLPDKPARIPAKIENIPDELKERPQWLLWKWEKRDGRWTKPPYKIEGQPASSTDPSTWAKFEGVVTAYGKGQGFDGIGYVLTKMDPYTGIDLDGSFNKEEGRLHDWGKVIVDSIKSYSEISPSGNGVKILLKGKLPKSGHHGEKIGVFDQSRYFAITGHVVNGYAKIEARQTELDSLVRREWPQDFETVSGTSADEEASLRLEDKEILGKARTARNGEKFLKLWNGQWQGDYSSQSEADQAFCSILSFWTQDREQIDRLFRASGLNRDKWERADYRERTISKALSNIKEMYKALPEARGAPTLGDVREYLDFNVDPGQSITSDEVCRGLGAYTRDHKKHIYAHLSRLVQEEAMKKDPYRRGGFRKPMQILAYSLDSRIASPRRMDVKLPLDLHNLVEIHESQITCIAGRYDAGKSSFLFHTMLLNYRTQRIIHFSSPEWDEIAIIEMMDVLGIERPHPNIVCKPMPDGYEDSIPSEPCIVLVDYIRTTDSPYDIDRQFHRILQSLHGGVALCAIQKHPGIDKPTGGQFAVHAPHHVILLDKRKDENAYICKILKSKSDRDLEGVFRVFRFEGTKLIPTMNNWKKGEIVWEKPNDNKDNDDNQKGTKSRCQMGGSIFRDKERKKEPKKERNENPVCYSPNTISPQEDVSTDIDDSEGFSF
jgi:primase-polymerase (primpol)-like protein